MTFSQANRRRHERITIELEYHLLLNGREYSGKTANISISGAYLSSPEPKLALSSLSQIGNLKIKLNDELLSLKCEIVHLTTKKDEAFPIGAGVCFVDNDDETRLAILKLIP